MSQLATKPCPLLFSGVESPVDYLLSEGIGSGCVTVEEVSEGGSVPNLLVENKGEIRILFKKIVAVDMFDKSSTCQKVWNRLMSGYVLDALEEQVDQKGWLRLMMSNVYWARPLDCPGKRPIRLARAKNIVPNRARKFMLRHWRSMMHQCMSAW